MLLTFHRFPVSGPRQRMGVPHSLQNSSGGFENLVTGTSTMIESNNSDDNLKSNQDGYILFIELHAGTLPSPWKYEDPLLASTMGMCHAGTAFEHISPQDDFPPVRFRR